METFNRSGPLLPSGRRALGNANLKGYAPHKNLRMGDGVSANSNLGEGIADNISHVELIDQNRWLT